MRIEKSLRRSRERGRKSLIIYITAGDPDFCMPNAMNIIFDEWDSEAFILMNKQQWALSNGSACTSDKITPSHVLEAMGLDAEKGGVRFSF